MLARTLIITIGILSLLTPAVSAQQDITETSISFSQEAGVEEGGFDRGQTRAPAWVRLSYTHGSPGLNPNEGTWTATLAIDMASLPDWIEMRFDAASDGAKTYVHGGSSYAAEDGGVDDSWDLQYDIADDAPWGAEGFINWTVTVTEDDDIGTFQSIATENSGSIPVRVNEQECDAVTGVCPGDEDDGDGGPSDDGGSNPDTEESPAFAPMLFLLALGLVAALRRRV